MSACDPDERSPLRDRAACWSRCWTRSPSASGRCSSSGRYILGPEVEAFEAEFAAYLGVRHCVGVANGTEALTIALRALGVGPGDEVVVPALTFYATAEAVVNAGATPVFCDVDPATLTMTAASCRGGDRRADEGAPAGPPLRQPGADGRSCGSSPASRGLRLLEDAAQAAGRPARRPPGRRRSATPRRFSFFPSKNLGGFGDGGAIADRRRGRRRHGSPAARARLRGQARPHRGRLQLAPRRAAGRRACGSCFPTSTPGRRRAARPRPPMPRAASASWSSCRRDRRRRVLLPPIRGRACDGRDALRRGLGRPGSAPAPITRPRCTASRRWLPTARAAASRGRRGPRRPSLALPMGPALSAEQVRRSSLRSPSRCLGRGDASGQRPGSSPSSATGPSSSRRPPSRATCAGLVEEILVHTGQHYDRELSAVFFEELGLPAPGPRLGVGSGSHAEQTAADDGRRWSRPDRRDRPDAVLVYGDTNATLGGRPGRRQAGRSRSSMSRPGCAPSTARCPRRSTGSSSTASPACCSARPRRRSRTSAPRGWRERAGLVGDVMADVGVALRARSPSGARTSSSASGWSAGGYLVATLHRAGERRRSRRPSRARGRGLLVAAASGTGRSSSRSTLEPGLGWLRQASSSASSESEESFSPSRSAISTSPASCAAPGAVLTDSGRHSEGGLPRRRALPDPARGDRVGRDRRERAEQAGRARPPGPPLGASKSRVERRHGEPPDGLPTARMRGRRCARSGRWLGREGR